MPFSIRARLSTMMFINYVIWGAWYVTISTYLTSTLHFTGTQAGAVFGTTALAAMISPFFVGLIADRFFSTERVLAVLHFAGAILLWRVAAARTFGEVYWILLAYCLCYFPTLALTNSLTLQHLKDPGRDFPLIRVFGTLWSGTWRSKSPPQLSCSRQERRW
jgi:MFS family permease